jgi:hypothetical protein
VWVFIAVIYEVIVFWIILSVSSHKGSMSSLLVWWRVSFGLEWTTVSMFSYHHTRSFVIMGFIGFLECLVSRSFLHLGMNSFMLLMSRKGL